MSQVLSDFIKDAVRTGKSRAEIVAALEKAGWSKEQISDAFAGYSDVDFPVPVPKPTSHVSSRYLALNLFFFFVLLLLIIGVNSIIFTLLDYYLPDGQGRKQGMFYNSYRPLGEAIRGYLAIVLVSTPLLLLSGKKIAQIHAHATRGVPLIRLRLIYLCYLIASLILLLDFIMFVYYFLSGELSVRFMLKVVTCVLTAAAVYFYFQPEAGKAEDKA